MTLSKDPFNDKLIPYIKGNKKTFWGFTSTSPNPEIITNFLGTNQKIKTGTIFTLTGEVWGYDITLFNYYKEEEVLLEPETKFIVDSVLPPVNDVINITCNIINSPLILEPNGVQSTSIINNNNLLNNNAINDQSSNNLLYINNCMFREKLYSPHPPSPSIYNFRENLTSPHKKFREILTSPFLIFMKK